MSTVYKYRIYCDTESAWKYIYGTDAPTTCPTNTAHTVDLDSVAIVQKISPDEVTVKQPTDGLFMTESKEMVIPSGTAGDITVIDELFDIKTILWVTELCASASMVGDSLDVIINPDTEVGALTSTGSISDTVLNVSVNVTGTVTPGMYITITDTNSPPTVQDLGKCVAVDGDAGTITLSNALSSEFLSGSVISVNVYMSKNLHIDAEGSHSFGVKGFQGKELPAGTVLRMLYTNNDTAAKTWYWKYSYYYGY